MSIALSEFWSRLVKTGLADGDACKHFAASYADQHGGTSPDSVTALAAFLVKSGHLSEFQAQALVATEAPAIRFGSFVMSSDQPVRPLTHWMPSQSVYSSAENFSAAPASRLGFLLRVPLTGLDENRRAWLAAHTSIESESLQPIELSGGAKSGDTEQVVEIFSALPTGISLWSVLQQKPKLSERKTVRIGCDLAEALHAMHGASPPMPHGAVGADHVWVTPKGNATLLRDPSSPARSPHAEMSGSWIERIEPAAKYAAPELANQSALPSVQSDIYSLGCLLFQILTGRPAFDGSDNATFFAAHQGALPEPLVQAVADGASGDPIMRVLAFAMAKDPAARFDSALAFRDALKSAGELVASGSAKKPPKSAKPKAAKPEPAKSEPAKQQTAKPIAKESVAKPSKKNSSAKDRTETVVDRSADPTLVRGANDNNEKSARPKAAPKTDSAPSLISEPTSAAKPPPTATPAAATPVAAQAQTAPSHADQPATASSPAASSPADSTQSAPSHSRKRRKRKRNRLPILGGIMVLPLLMLGLAIALNGRGPEKPKPRPRPQASAIRNVPKVGQARRDVTAPQGPLLVNGYEVVDSDRLLWVPPYSADSLAPSLELLPPGPAGIISISVASLVGNEDAKSILESFGPEIDSLIQMATKRVGVDREQIQRCTVSLFPGKQGWPETAFAIELVEPVAVAKLTEKWNAGESRTPEGATVYAGDDLDSDAFYLGDGDQGKLPRDETAKRFAVGSLKRIREIAENDGGAIPLVRNLKTLWERTSTESDLVVLMTPNFLFADGREMIAASVPEFRDPLNRWLIPNASGLSLSADVSDRRLYVELRQSPSGSATPAILLKQFRESVSQWQSWADNFLLNSKQDSSWLLLATRMPLMFRFVSQQIRSTIDQDTMVASAYLPVDAAAQTGLAALLAMNTPLDATTTDTDSGTQKPLSVAELLERKMSISFTQESLQFAVAGVVDEFSASLPSGSTMPPVRIIGGDLEKKGITQNQQIRGFERSDQTLRSVLTDLVLGANPDKTATGPTDPKQSLVWVVHPPGQPASKCEILVTTRDAAEGKYELPDEFVSAPQ